MTFYQFALGLVRAVFFPIYRVKIHNRERIPEGGAVVCGNHTALSDPVFAAFGTGSAKPLTFMAKAELFKNRLLRKVLLALGAFPINRGKADVSAIKQALTNLKDGKLLLIFPEGTRNKDGTAEAKAGAGMLALRGKVPVVPVYVTENKHLFGRINVVFGEPYFPSCEGKPETDDYIRISNEALARVRALAKTVGE